jgi:hypothetical protein
MMRAPGGREEKTRRLSRREGCGRDGEREGWLNES